MEPQNANLLEALRTAQEALSKCDAYYGESNDDSCRHIYTRIKDMMREQQQLVEQEIESHKRQGKWTQ